MFLSVSICSILVFVLDIIPIVKNDEKNFKLAFILTLLLIISIIFTFIINFNTFNLPSIAHIFNSISNSIFPKSLINFLQS